VDYDGGVALSVSGKFAFTATPKRLLCVFGVG
jgi:hypothetical protein